MGYQVISIAVDNTNNNNFATNIFKEVTAAPQRDSHDILAPNPLPSCF